MNALSVIALIVAMAIANVEARAPSHCQLNRFERFYDKYERKCFETLSFADLETQSLESLRRTWHDEDGGEIRCHFFTEAKIFLEDDLTECLPFWHYYAKNVECLNEAEANPDLKDEFGNCLADLTGEGIQRPCGHYINCMRKIVVPKCPGADAIICDRYMETFHILTKSEGIGFKCDWNHVHNVCRNVSYE
ncbi:hypothetical protein L596_021739 [Steinernema carpocapsae]|uniref:DUF19 domain-containing protein n=1 Tax=Steinernema carpocapsae TaxID=34508 RepID=A0A4U5MJM5_STECR|nr:hypothetical protein L596_021739 [Steinernema carpocapsae]